MGIHGGLTTRKTDDVDPARQTAASNLKLLERRPLYGGDRVARHACAAIACPFLSGCGGYNHPFPMPEANQFGATAQRLEDQGNCTWRLAGLNRPLRALPTSFRPRSAISPWRPIYAVAEVDVCPGLTYTGKASRSRSRRADIMLASHRNQGSALSDLLNSLDDPPP
jgi:hypothetical protein